MARKDTGTTRLFILALAVCVAALGTAYYLQHVERLDPCPWCIVQRLLFMALALVCLIALVHRPASTAAIRCYAGVAGLLASAGVAAAGYQIWLQQDPVRATRCVGSPLERLLDSSGVGQWWPGFLQYDGPCSLTPWSFFGLGIPEWSLTWFVVLAGAFVSKLFARTTR